MAMRRTYKKNPSGFGREYEETRSLILQRMDEINEEIDDITSHVRDNDRHFNVTGVMRELDRLQDEYARLCLKLDRMNG